MATVPPTARTGVPTPAPAVRCADVLIIVEGASRIRWVTDTSRTWSPVAFWPDGAEAAEVALHLEKRQPLLVVLDDTAVMVPVWDHELDRAPANVAALAVGEGDLLDLRVPALDWLPAPLRHRGLDFWRTSTARLAGTPTALLPPLLFDTPEQAAEDTWHVRFARRTRPFPLTGKRLTSVVAHAFPRQETPRG